MSWAGATPTGRGRCWWRIERGISTSTTRPPLAAEPRRRFDRQDASNGVPRLFVGVPLDEAARAAVQDLVASVRATEPDGRGVRWVRLEGLHVTLRFLGPTPEDRIEAAAAAVQMAAAGFEPFHIRLAGAGAFPSSGRPRTLWLAITDGAASLAGLAQALGGALAGAGWPREERPFRAHLTLARADGVRAGPATAAALAAAAKELAVPSAVDRIVLYETITGGGPARYLVRSETALG
jgi:RNA 2',3'-cyclic 3'-phosphodiesterase